MTYRPANTRNGFTLMEILIAVAIIGLLAAVAAFGFKAALNGQKVSGTRALLNTGRSILNEYALATKNASSVTIWDWDGATVNTANAPYATQGLNLLTAPFRYEANTAPIDSSDPVAPMPAPATADLTEWQIANTKLVVTQMRRVPAVAALLGSLPKDALESGGNPPLMVDAWNRPLLYVSPGGLGRLPLSIDTTTTDRVKVGGVETIVFSPDRKGFWASAGPDGNFTTGDDNLYSFEN